MKKVSADTIIRTIVLFVAVINNVLLLIGKNPLPFSEDDLYSTLSALATAITALWAWWKNNDFTQEALEAGSYLKELKSNKHYSEV